MKASSSVPKFLTKIWALVEDPRNSAYICWSQDGNSFIVLDEESFAKEILPRHFKHNNMASFVRQLNWYGFHKVMQDESAAARHDKYCSGRYQHPFFKRGQEELLIKIKRKVTSSTGDKRVFRKAKVSIPRIEEGKSGPDDMQKILTFLHQLQARQDVLDSTVESLKRENEALWKEVIQLRPAQPQFEPVGASHYEQMAPFHSNQPLMIDSTGNYNQLSASKASQAPDHDFENRSPWFSEQKPIRLPKRDREDHDSSTEEPNNHIKTSLHREYEHYNTDESDDPSDHSSFESEMVINEEDTASNYDQSFTNQDEVSVAHHRKQAPHKRLKSYTERQDSTIKRRIVYSGSENEDEQNSCHMDSGSGEKSSKSCRSPCYKLDRMLKQMHRDHTRLTKKVLAVEQQSLKKLSDISTALSTLTGYIMNTQNPQRASCPPFLDAAKTNQNERQGSQSHHRGLWSGTTTNHSTKREYES